MSTMNKAVYDETTPFTPLFMLLLGESLAIMIGFVMTLFFTFHTYLMCKAMTTIEFCEKSKDPRRNTSIFCQSVLGNIKAVLGDNMWLWFLPCSPASGDGLHFITEETPLWSEIWSAGHEQRRRTHTQSSYEARSSATSIDNSQDAN
jgi:hypothetical protein